MSYNNGVVITLSGELVFEYEDTLSNDDGGVCGMNYTMHIIKPPLVILTLFLVVESCVTFVVNLNFNLGIKS
jgi:hypothetical protein